MNVAVYHFGGKEPLYPVSQGGRTGNGLNIPSLAADEGMVGETGFSAEEDSVSISDEAMALYASSREGEESVIRTEDGSIVGGRGGETLNVTRKRASEAEESGNASDQTIAQIKQQIQETQKNLDTAMQNLEAAKQQARSMTSMPEASPEASPAPPEQDTPEQAAMDQADPSQASSGQAGAASGESPAAADEGDVQQAPEVKTEQMVVQELRNKLMQLNNQLAEAMREASGGGTPGLPGIPCGSIGSVGGNTSHIGSPNAPYAAPSAAPAASSGGTTKVSWAG